jgi:hypothetical protein
MKSNISSRLKYLQQYITAQRMTDVAYPAFVKNTPVRTGYAKQHTTRTANEIDAAYPYAKRLDEGYSKQSPKGMVEPAIQAVRDYVRKTLGR